MQFSITQIVLLGISLIWSSVRAIEPARQPYAPTGNGEKLLTFNNTVLNNSFSASSVSVSWLSGAEEDGQYVYQGDDGSLKLENFVTGESSTIVATELIPEDVWEYWLRPDFAKVLFATNYTKQYRHSYFADYYILDVASGELSPIVEGQAGDIQYAEFAPSGDAIAFVRGNDLFLNKNGNVSQITNNGSPDLFNGVPDWVYEEEIFGTRSSLWFSPDGEVLAFLSFNETGVETFSITYYMDNQEIAPVYPRINDLRYPKVGTTNPTVSLSLLTVESEETTSVQLDPYELDDLIIGEIAWVTEGHSSLIYRAFNRVQDMSKHVLVEVDKKVSSSIVRERDGTDGWLDNSVGITYVGSVNGSSSNYYIDLSDEDGWQHLYLYSLDSLKTIQLTKGEFEVVSILKIDPVRELIYFTSTQGDSTERHVYSVSWTTSEITPLVDDKIPAYWSASFSSGGGYYILSYQGPDVPYQELYSVNDTTTPVRTITSNRELWDTLQGYSLPNTTFFKLKHPDGWALDVKEVVPPNFDVTKKYPVLFTPYGGPGAQEVDKTFQAPNWNLYISSDAELEYITYTVDGRGSGYQGRGLRSTVASHLGEYEADDQIWAAQELIAKNSYIDASKIGIFGWSYGGYLSAKVVEADSGVFTTALIVAPVTDWRFYDSMYTERYMKTTQINPDGYDKTAVRLVDGFKNLRGSFTILHGLGDDNVHYQNSAAMLDLLVGAGVSPAKFDWRAFTDSDHSINYNGATTYLRKHLTAMLFKEKTRVEQEMVHQWSKKSTLSS
ncbi:dipeptidyl peptidase IV N-terminal region-domain-containing protein [Xylariaceae sp. FL1272]|nr:dipeptidyl peptidase IV N-terminal region-domain-containing protein [Xylariaceae sp. FL1272]